MAWRRKPGPGSGSWVSSEVAKHISEFAAGPMHFSTVGLREREVRGLGHSQNSGSPALASDGRQ